MCFAHRQRRGYTVRSSSTQGANRESRRPAAACLCASRSDETHGHSKMELLYKDPIGMCEVRSQCALEDGAVEQGILTPTSYASEPLLMSSSRQSNPPSQRGAAVGHPRPICWQHHASFDTDHCLIKQW